MSKQWFALLLLPALYACAPATAPAAQGPRLFVSLERGDAVVAIDPASGKLVGRFAAGKRPRGMRLSPDGKTLYVAVSGSAIAGPGVDERKLPPPDRSADGIAVVDLASGKVDRVLPAGNDPETFAIAPDGRTLFVSNEDSGTVSAIATDGSRPPRSAKVGDEPEGVAVSADGARLFVACETSDHVAMLDARTLRLIGTVAIEGRPRTLLLSRDGKSLFVAVEGAGRLAILSAATGEVQASIDLRGTDPAVRPMGMTQLPGGELLVTTGRAGAVLVIDPAQRKLVRRIDHVGARPWGIAQSGARVATANGPSGDVTIFDAASGKIVATVKAGASPWGVVAS